MAWDASIKRKLRVYQCAVLFFWWLALFPGRLGFDYAEMARLIRVEESSAWWGATFFWFFKFLTFDAKTLAVASLVGLITLMISIRYLVSSLPISDPTREKVCLVVFLTPFFGVFGANVSHDVYQVAGTLILSATILRYSKYRKLSNTDYKYMFLAGLCLTTTQYGIAILFLVLVVIFRDNFKASLAVLVSCILLIFLAQTNISPQNRTFIRQLPTFLMIIDLKCITQHPEIIISESEWRVLEQYAPRQLWKVPISCASQDPLLASLGLKYTDLELKPGFVSVFFNIVSRAPAIPFIAHIQRSSVALPPPFFQPPQNSVSWDLSEPIGIRTNVALQEFGTQLFHLSIDDEMLSARSSLFRPLELLALSTAFVVNQASWFWSWGGFWLLVIVLCFLQLLGRKPLLLFLLPSLMLHSILFFISPVAIGRYVMSTIIIGITSIVVAVFQKLESQRDKKN